MLYKDFAVQGGDGYRWYHGKELEARMMSEWNSIVLDSPATKA